MNELDQGFRLESRFISQATINELIGEITNSNNLKSPHGIRNAEKKFDCIAKLANSEKIIAQARSILGKEPQLVRAIFFDKTPEKNWLVS